MTCLNLLKSGMDAFQAIITTSRPLHERLAACVDEGHPSGGEAVERTLESWCATVANGDRGAFDRRLAWDGFCERQVRRVLEDASPAPLAAPPWAQALQRAYGRTSAEVVAAFGRVKGPREYLRPGDPLPFEALFNPLVLTARQKVREWAGGAYEELDRNAHAALERSLLKRLSRVTEQALYVEFAAFRVCRNMFADPHAQREQPDREEAFTAFLKHMQTGGWLTFLQTYSVAARLLGQLTTLWVEATTAFMQHLFDDAHALERMFNAGRPLGRVVAVQSDVADYHRGGRSVLIVRFEAGCTVVYKPRPLPVECFYASLLEWLNGQGALLPLKAVRIVPRPTHGWLEFIEHKPCSSEEEVKRFFLRCGMLLCLAYVFNGTDFHYENLIASGEHPFLIDMEGLLKPRFCFEERLPGQDFAAESAREKSVRSVLNLRMLPLVKVIGEHHAVDTSSLGEMPTFPVTVERWADINRDTMRPARRAVPLETPHKHLLFYAGKPVRAADNVEQIIQGFRHTYQVLRRRHRDLTAPDGLLGQLREKRVRFILRNTSLYGTLLERCLHPKYLRRGTDRSIQLDGLCRPLLKVQERPAVWPALIEERAALEQMDIPLFEAPANGTSLILPSGEVVPACFEQSAVSEVEARLDALSVTDLELQTGLIRAAFRVSKTHDLRIPKVMPTRVAEQRRDRRSSHEATSPVHLRLLAEAIRVAEVIHAGAIHADDGSLAWLGVNYVPSVRRYRVGPTTLNLFTGYCGIALFFAALARVSGEIRFRKWALASLKPFRTRIPALLRALRLRRNVDVGIGTGMAGVLYTLCRSAAWLHEPVLYEEARRVASLLDPEVIKPGPAFDVLSGAAGAVLGLLTLHDATGDGAWLETALRWGRHLIAGRTCDPRTQAHLWPSRYGTFEAGFAYGQSGIAYALMRLGSVAGDDSLCEVAVRTLNAERSMLGLDWEQVRREEPVASWSYGAAGVGLARLACLQPGGASPLRADLARAVNCTRTYLFEGTDTLCCGTLGRIDFLLSCALQIGDDHLLEEVRSGACALMDRASSEGTYRHVWGGAACAPGLFLGASGIGYTLLRIGFPDLIPSVLSWN